MRGMIVKQAGKLAVKRGTLQDRLWRVPAGKRTLSLCLAPRPVLGQRRRFCDVSRRQVPLSGRIDYPGLRDTRTRETTRPMCRVKIASSCKAEPQDKF